MFLEINFTMVVFALSFLVFINLLNITFIKPVGAVVEARKNQIQGDYESSSTASEEAETVLSDYNTQIKTARAEALELVTKTVNAAEEKKKSAIANLMTELNKDREAALNKIEEEEKVAMKDLQEKIKSLNELIIGKVIGEKTLVGSR